MFSSEILQEISDALLRDERILTSAERELLRTLVVRASGRDAQGDGCIPDNLARALGETIAERTFAMLGNSVAERLIAADVSKTGGFHLGPQPPSPRPPGPAPSPGQPPGSYMHLGPQPPSPRPPGPSPSPGQPPGSYMHVGPQPPSPRPPGPSPSPGQPPGSYMHLGPQPPSPRPPGPSPSPGQPPRQSATHAQVGVMAAEAERSMEVSDAVISAQCVVLEEFLTPVEVSSLIQETLAREAEFHISEVVSPGVAGTTVDYERRRSRVLMDLGKTGEALVERIRQCLPRVLPRLGHEVFPITDVESQITASNDGDFFGWHADNSGEAVAAREITFVYFFHREPKQFRGGELRIYDSRLENGGYVPTRNYRVIVPEQNQLVMFPSMLAHEITPIGCPSRAFADSRFTVNGWFRR